MRECWLFCVYYIYECIPTYTITWRHWTEKPAELWTECEYYSDLNHFIVQWIKRESLRHCNDGQSPEKSKWFGKRGTNNGNSKNGNNENAFDRQKSVHLIGIVFLFHFVQLLCIDKQNDANEFQRKWNKRYIFVKAKNNHNAKMRCNLSIERVQFIDY